MHSVMTTITPQMACIAQGTVTEMWRVRCVDLLPFRADYM